LDEYNEAPSLPPSLNDNREIGFRNATFTWTTESTDSSQNGSQRNFQLKVEGELLFRKGCVNLILGPTGSGKTSLLHALLSEMHFVPSDANSWYHLPRENGVAYAAQESWVQNATIKVVIPIYKSPSLIKSWIQENILLKSEFNEDRYNKVIYQCALEHDLNLFQAGDETEVGERGLTLSGGQKARLTLARAVYSKAEIILLDDILAALEYVLVFLAEAVYQSLSVYIPRSGLSKNVYKGI